MAPGEKAVSQSKRVWTDVDCEVRDDLLVYLLANLERELQEVRGSVTRSHFNTLTDTMVSLKCSSAMEEEGEHCRDARSDVICIWICLRSCPPIGHVER